MALPVVVVVVALRLLARPAVSRALYVAERASAGPALASAVAMWERWTDPDESDEDLSAAISARSATLAEVATYTGEFRLRKLQVIFERLAAAGASEDVALVTFHYLKLSGSTPVDDWGAADFEGSEARIDALWTIIKPYWAVDVVLKQMRWYLAGPEFGPDNPAGPAVRVVERNVAGTQAASTSSNTLPPQVALSVTEKTSDPKAWGRFYLPGPFRLDGTNPAVGRYGRWHSTLLGTVADACDGLYEGQRTDSRPIVVYSSAKPVRPKKPSGTLPATVARALTVDNLQVDDIPDVIRSRRWDTTLLRVQRAVG